MKARAYHVTTLKKLHKYIRSGCIKPPVRGWLSIAEAERFSKQTGRRIILRLNLQDPTLLEGHKRMAVVSDHPVPVPEGIV